MPTPTQIDLPTPALRPAKHILILATTLVWMLSACASVPAPAPTPPPAPVATPAAAATQDLSLPLHWTRNSAEQRALFLQTYRHAAAALEELAAGREPFTWAVSVDGDETILDNSLYQKEREALGEGFTLESWIDWVRRREATALPGTLDFLETVRGLGGKIAVVTNRGEEVCGATADNLRSLRLPFDVVLCKPLGGSSDKAPRWQAVVAGTADDYLPPLEIVMWVGDNIQDFPGGSQALATPDDPDSRRTLERFGDDFFLLPNVMYGSWVGNPQQ